MSSILQKQIGQLAAATPIITTTELLLAYSGRVEATYPTLRYIIVGWASISWGTGTTFGTLRIRRGNGIAGALVATASPINAIAGNTSEVQLKFTEQLINVEFADYSLTIQQTAATANGTAQLSTIEVESING